LGYSDQRIAGAILFVGALQFIIGMNLAEQLYPSYSVSMNYISDLGATCRVSCEIVQPSSSIFNSSIILLALLIIIGSYFIQRAFGTKFVTVPLVLAGIGAAGVGLFPETAGSLHSIFSFITFLFGGLSAIVAYRIEKPPLNYFSVMLGVITLTALVLYVSKNFLGLGPGGMERMIAYPVLLWGIGLGGHMMQASKDPRQVPFDMIMRS
jgi:hypothetical membrane protein